MTSWKKSHCEGQDRHLQSRSSSQSFIDLESAREELTSWLHKIKSLSQSNLQVNHFSCHSCNISDEGRLSH
eukprot:scaffold1664_cov233-Chaetoceros_neogracile.AAC.8